jgi:hypothetical protein
MLRLLAGILGLVMAMGKSRVLFEDRPIYAADGWQGRGCMGAKVWVRAV